MAVVEIPIEPSKNFSFRVTLDAQVVAFDFIWNDTSQYWVFNLKGLTLTDEVKGAAVVTGIDLLKPYAIRELGQLFCLDTTGLGADPDFENFGTHWVLTYIELDTDLDI